MSDRKLIRPSMTEMMDRFPTRGTTGRRKQVPAEQTNAENFYYLKQMQSRTTMIVVLTDAVTEGSTSYVPLTAAVMKSSPCWR